MTAPKVLVTGASGLVGEALVFRLLLDKRLTPIAAVRGATRLLGLCKLVPFDLTRDPVTPSLEHVEVVVHAAARVHVMNDVVTDALAAFRKVNVDGTVRLARMAAEAGVKRFVFVSSIKVNGENSPPDSPFTADDIPSPNDSYGISKLEAEQALKQVGRETGMEIVIVRPPLVYGPRVKANFLKMLEWLDKGVPLPLGSIDNRRSLASVTNLVDLLVTCIDHPAAANQTFLVSDGGAISTTRLLESLSGALGKKSRLLPVPAWILVLVASIARKQDVAKRVIGSLEVDISKNLDLLGWTPPASLQAGLRKTAAYYLEQKKK